MKIYLVGGSVRDKLLGFPSKERDYVVVGSTVSEMLKQGYRQVGKEFPVFLHPKTNEEYALARMEKKVKPGYKGFTFDTSPDVTLEADLERRDLTINAMALTSDGQLIDPYHGQQDLAHKILRHVSPAFAEDPVRILRVGRFYARYVHLGFEIAPETIELMRTMVKKGEVDALVAERVWKEFERALQEKNPEAFFTVLSQCDALGILFPELMHQERGIKALIAAEKITAKPIVRFAALLHALKKVSVQGLCHRYRVPNAYRELAILSALHYQEALNFNTLTANERLTLFNRLDVWRREERFLNFLQVCKAIASLDNIPFDETTLSKCANAARSVDVRALLSEGLQGEALVKKIEEKRREKITQFLKS